MPDKLIAITRTSNHGSSLRITLPKNRIKRPKTTRLMNIKYVNVPT